MLRVEGLSSVVSEGELKERFQPFGKITAVRRRLDSGKDSLPGKECALLEVEMTDANLHKCISSYNKTRWKGCQLRVCLDEGGTPPRVHREKDVQWNSSVQDSLGVGARKEQPSSRRKTIKIEGDVRTQSIKRTPKKEIAETTRSQRCALATTYTGTSDRKQGVKLPNDQQASEGRSLSQASSREEKRQLSNQRRLKAIQQRRETAASKSKLNIDSKRESSASQHIVFSNSEESGGSDGELCRDSPLRRTLFSSEDSGESDSDQFAVRDEFEGKAGRKLFKLQQKIGIDKRFQLDKRFLDEDDDGSDTSDGTTSSLDQDELSEQLQKEKVKSLSILDSILGSKARHTSSSKDVSSLFPQRYDPTSSDCVDLEQPPESEEHSGSESSEPVTTATEVPTISQEKYYTVSNDLKSMFGSSSGGHTFDFLDGEVEEERGEVGVAEEIVRLKPRWMQGSSDSRGDPVTTSDVGSSSVMMHKPKVLFFFHSANEELVNRLEENTFYRSRPLEELDVGWGERRVGMTHSYKRRHRDAVKLARKKRKHSTI